MNTTVGLLGIIDVANKMGFPKYVKEDYGQTLGAWGVGPGCYIVLPVLGPSTVRDTLGSFANVMGGDPWYNASMHGNNEFLSERIYMTSKALSGIEFRANNIDSLDNLEKNSVDFTNTFSDLTYEKLSDGSFYQTEDFKINLTANWSYYRNKVLDLKGVESIRLGGLSAVSGRADEGYPLGVFWGTKFSRNDDGSIFLNSIGFP